MWQTFAWEESARWVSHTWEVIGRLNELAVATNDGNADAIALNTQRIGQLTRDNPVQQRNLRDLSPAGVRRMQVEEESLLRARTEKQSRQTKYSRWLFAGAGLLSLVLIGVAGRTAALDVKRRRSAEETLAIRDEQYRQVVENAGDVIYTTDFAGRFTFCNQAALTMLHLTEDEVIGRSYLRLIRPDYKRRIAIFYRRQTVRRKKNSYCEFPLIDGFGRERWMGQNVQLLRDGEEIVGFQAIARDITERKRAELELDTSRAFVERIAATTPGILYVYDLQEARNVYSNREVVSVLGYKPEELQVAGKAIGDFVHPDDLAAIRRHYEALAAARDGEVMRLQYRARHADGHWVWLAARDTPFLRDENGRVKQIVGIAQDITSRREAQEKLAYQANYDALTGLSNRHHFFTRLQSILRRSSLEHSTATLCIFDIDLFKEINDRFGHAAGDEVLEALGTIVTGELRTVDVAGRLGGDEFCFVLPETDRDEAARVADRIRERLGTMAFGMGGGGSPFSVTATFGVAEWHAHVEAKDLMEAADRALYRAKAAGRNRVCVDV